MKKKILAGATALAVALGLSLATALPANAEENPNDPNSAQSVVVSDTPAEPTVSATPADPPAEPPAPAVADPPAADPVADPPAPDPVADPPAAEPAPDPAVADPAPDPAAGDPVTDPAATDPAAADPVATDQAAADPATADPATDPLAAESTSESTKSCSDKCSEEHDIKVEGHAEASDQMCRHGKLVDGRIEVDVQEGVDYKITDSDHDVIWFDQHTGRTDRLASGHYKVEVSARHGYELVSEKTIWLKVHSFDGDCGFKHVTGSASAFEQSCPDGELVDGRITVGVKDGVDYEITNSDNEVIPFDESSGQTAGLPSGDYTVQVTAQEGFKLKSDKHISLTIDAFKGECELITHPLVTPTLSSTPITCTAGGSYTLNAIEGVVWNVNGTVVAAGTYQVPSAQTVDVLATTASSDVGFEKGAQTSWQLVFAGPTDCVQAAVVVAQQLPTLAATGMTGGGISTTVLTGLLFLLAGSGVYTVARVKNRNR